MKKYFVSFNLLIASAFAAETVVFKEPSTSGVDNPDLHIIYSMKDGTEENTKNKRFLNAKHQRGDQATPIGCTGGLSGRLSQTLESEIQAVGKVDCFRSVGTFEDEDNESLRSTIEERLKVDAAGTFVREDLNAELVYAGNETRLGDEALIVMGKHRNGIFRARNLKEGTLSQSENNPNKNPFELALSINKMLKPLLGRPVTINEADLEIRGRIISLRWSLNVFSRLQVTAHLDRSFLHFVSTQDPVSLLKTEDVLSSGYDFNQSFERVKAALRLQ